MSKNDAVDFSTPFEELFGGGGSYFQDGVYRIELADFTYYDFNKPGNDSLCLHFDLQPLENGKDSGDPVTRYWPIGDKLRDGTITVEPCSPIKGRKGCFSQVRLTEANTHGKLFAFSDFGLFMGQAAKAEVDMDAIGNDITNFEGNVYEFGKMLKPEKKKTALSEAEGEGDPKKSPSEVIVIVGPGESKGKGKGSSKADTKAKGKAKEEEEEEEDKPKGKSKAKGKQTPEDYVREYLEAEVCTDDNEDGTPWMTHRTALARWLAKDKGLDAETTKAAMQIYNDKEDALPALLTSMGWEFDDGEIKKS